MSMRSSSTPERAKQGVADSLGPNHGLEHRLGAYLREQFKQGMRLTPRLVRTVRQVLAAQDAAESGRCLEQCADCEASSMRDLVLFPDNDLALAVETWLLEEEGQTGEPPRPDPDVLARLLDEAPVTLIWPDLASLRLYLTLEEAGDMVGRLSLGSSLPPALSILLISLRKTRNATLIPALRLACKRAQLEWTAEQTDFVSRLVQGSLQAGADEPLGRDPLGLVQWCVAFLAHAGEDIPAALARRRDEVRRLLDQAEELARVRDKYNFETRRMFGVVEQHLEPEKLRAELGMLELSARATGGYGPQHQVMHRNLGDARAVTDLL